MISKIVKRDGTVVDFDAEKLNLWGEWAASINVEWGSIVLGATRKCFDGCTTEDLQKAMISECVDRETTQHLKMAGRLFIGSVYKKAFGNWRNIPTVLEMYKKMSSLGLWAEMDYSDEELSSLESVINHKLDLQSTYTETKQIMDKYAIVDRVDNKMYESPQFVYMRMALGNMEKMPKERRMQDVAKLYQYLSEKKINAPTPFSINLGTPKKQYASCCVTTTIDTAASLAAQDHIAYMMTCASAGIGSHIKSRSKGDKVRGGAVQHQGKLPYYRVQQAVVGANLQSSRGGANTMHFNVLDPELMDLLVLKNVQTVDQKKIKDIDYSVGYNEEFVRRVAKNESWMLVSYGDAPDLYEAMYKGNQSEFLRLYAEVENNESIPKQHLEARAIAIKFLTEGVETGRMYLHRTDEMNRHSPFKDTIYSSNLCFTGDTLVAVADGRNAVSISQLAKESEGVVKFPVYSARHKRNNHLQGSAWKSEIKNAVAFSNGVKEVVEVMLSDGSSFKCTADHRIALPNGQYKEAKDLVGVDVEPFFTSLGNSRKYRHINSATNGHSKQHSMLWKFNNGDIPKGYNIDHIVNVADDRLDNLQLLTKAAHKEKTSLEVSGTNNAMHKLKDKVINTANNCAAHHMEKNGRYLGLTNEDMIGMARQLLSQGEDVTLPAMRKLDSRMPKSFSKNRFGGKFSNLVAIAKEMSVYCPPKVPERLCYDTDIFSVNNLTVVSVTPCGKEVVYDLTVEDNHNFNIITRTLDEGYLQCSGVLVHNCQEIGLPTLGYPSVFEVYKEYGKGEIGLCSLSAICQGNVLPEEYESVAYYTLLMIDNVIDIMEYPFKQLETTAKARRSIGVGITNLAYDMASKGLTYSSKEGKQYIHRLAEQHSYWLHKASLRLAKERGVCEWIVKTKYPCGWLPIDTANKEIDNVVQQPLVFDWESLRKEIVEIGGLRNSVLEAHMPCESSSVGSGTTNGLYPIRSFKVVKTSGTNKNLFIAPELEKLKQNYELAWDISTKDMIDVYAIVQKFTGQGISADLYIKYAKDAERKVSVKDMLTEFLYMTKMGLKTRYYVNSSTGVEVAMMEDQEQACDSCSL